MTTIHHGLDVNGLAGLGSGSTDKTQAAQAQPAPAPTQTLPTSSPAPGEVEITSTAQLLATLEQQISSTPDINQSRVDSLHQALNNGSYQIDSSRIADGLLAAQKFDAQAAAGSVPGTQSNPIKAFAATAQLGSDTE